MLVPSILMLILGGFTGLAALAIGYALSDGGKRDLWFGSFFTMMTIGLLSWIYIAYCFAPNDAAQWVMHLLLAMGGCAATCLFILNFFDDDWRKRWKKRS